jgi:pimeloyl-ACP methyl ester carboxylesterase
MLLVDLLGYGFSDRPSAFGYAVEDHARILSGFAAHLPASAVDLFGHSMGGSVAIVAAKLLGNKVRRLILSEPNFAPGGGVFSRKIAAMSEAEFVQRGHAEMVAASKAEGNDIWAASLAVSAPYAVHRGATSLVVGSKPTWRELLYEMTLPRTVIFGEASLPDADTKRLAEHGVAIDVVPKAGHSMATENPTGFAEALRRALS